MELLDLGVSVLHSLFVVRALAETHEGQVDHVQFKVLPQMFDDLVQHCPGRLVVAEEHEVLACWGTRLKVRYQQTVRPHGYVATVAVGDAVLLQQLLVCTMATSSAFIVLEVVLAVDIV